MSQKSKTASLKKPTSSTESESEPSLSGTSEFDEALTTSQQLAQISASLANLSNKFDIVAAGLSELRQDHEILRKEHTTETATLKQFNSQLQNEVQEQTSKTQVDLQYLSSTCSTNNRTFQARLDSFDDRSPPENVNQVFVSLTAALKLFTDTLLSFKRSTDQQFLASRDLQEMNYNRVSGPTDDSFISMIQAFYAYKKYKSGNGSISFYDLMSRSPDVLELYLEKARRTNVHFVFNTEDDIEFFRELLDHVFHPDGITVSAFNQLVAVEKMTEFSPQAAARFKTWVYFLTKIFHLHLPDSLVPQLWDRVSKNAFPTGFQYSLLNYPPRSLKDFAKTIEARASVFRDNNDGHGQFHHPSTPNRSSQFSADTARSSQTTSFSPANRDRRPVNNVTTRDTCSRCRTSEHSNSNCPFLFCPPCDRIATDCNHYPENCTVDHSESDQD